MKGDEFWDYDQQVDMEGFNSSDFFSILGKQSRDVTAAISRQKDQVSVYRTWLSSADSKRLSKQAKRLQI